MPPDDEGVYVLYQIIGDGEEHTVEIVTKAALDEMPYFLPSESYMWVRS